MCALRSAEILIKMMIYAPINRFCAVVILLEICPALEGINRWHPHNGVNIKKVIP